MMPVRTQEPRACVCIKMPQECSIAADGNLSDDSNALSRTKQDLPTDGWPKTSRSGILPGEERRVKGQDIGTAPYDTSNHPPRVVIIVPPSRVVPWDPRCL